MERTKGPDIAKTAGVVLAALYLAAGIAGGGKPSGDTVVYALMGNGYIESPDKPVKPDSLFGQQLNERIGVTKASAVLK